MRDLVKNRWFALADLVLVSLCGLIWYTWPQVGGWLFLVALLPWFVRLVSGSPPYQWTPLDLVLVVFIITAVVGLWATYDLSGGWDKFWIIVGAILLFYALAGQPRANLWPVLHLIAGFGAFLAIYFLLIYDWTVKPTDIAVLTRIGLWWMGIRPGISASELHPNIAGSILAVFFPLSVALVVYARRKQNRFLLLFAIFTGVLLLMGLLLASSRLAWIALGISLGLWALWELSAYLARRTPLGSYTIFAIGVLFGVMFVYWMVSSTPGGVIVLLDQLPGSDNASSRLEVIRDVTKLVPDYPYTGGGLVALPGLYSQYIRVVPEYTINNSHNLFLNIALEQGYFGLGFFILMLLVSLWSLKKSQFDRYYRWAVLAGFLVLIFIGLADDPFYGGRGTPLLLLLPGLAMALGRVEEKTGDEILRSTLVLNVRVRWAIIMGGLLLVTLLAFSFWKSLVAGLYANLGSVQMARYELDGFPIDDWDERRDLELLGPSYDNFTRSIALNPYNFTAQYRMGLIAMRARDFESAVSHLQVAYSLDPEHRGLRKVLGYAYLWTGQFDKAVPLMIDIPWIEGEIRSYRKWWQTQGRGDLSRRADRMLNIVKEIKRDAVP